MRILMRIDQAAALRSGIDAPSSTEQVEVDPGQLTEIERQVLAAVLMGGHDATQLGIQTEPDGIVGQVWRRVGARIECRADGQPTAPLLAIRPGLEGLCEAIARILAERDRMRAERAERKAAEQREYDEQTLAAIQEAAGQTEQKTVYLDRDGDPCDAYHSVVHTEIQVPRLPYYWAADRASPEVVHSYQGLRSTHEAERDRLIALAVAEMRDGPYVEWQAEQAQQQAEYDVLYARLPESLRQRDAAGYASETEVEKALRALARADAGYGGYAGWSGSEKLETLTDDEYARLQEIQAAAPEGATVEARLCRDGGWRRAIEEDDEDEIDSDGEVDDRTNFRRQAVIEWTVAGRLEVRAVEPLS